MTTTARKTDPPGIRGGTGRSSGPSPSPRGRNFGSSLNRWDFKYSPYLYVLPFFVLFAIVGLAPLVYTAWVALNSWNLIAGQGDFVGLSNFTEILGESDFWKALRNTLSIFVLTMVPHLIIGLVIAAALDRNIRAGTFWRMSVLVPYVVTPVAIALIFNSFFADESGLANSILTDLGLNPIGWHQDVLASHVAISTMVNFRWLGNTALILLAGMQAIPRDLYEAASVDGAKVLRQFFSITIPQLRPTMIFVILTMTIGGLQIFAEPRLYDYQGQGGPDKQWLTLPLYIYNLGWGELDFGLASAAAWLLFLLIIVFALINLFISTRIARNEARRNE
ncbi:carbohydrate ABC transporter permease [Agreia sp.]|uniref:carbohydrate ABC transporter permease n=1 Tax=Agreia sp. TaxID=1872416 RepID=UPI0035BC8532